MTCRGTSGAEMEEAKKVTDFAGLGIYMGGIILDRRGMTSSSQVSCLSSGRTPALEGHEAVATQQRS